MVRHLKEFLSINAAFDDEIRIQCDDYDKNIAFDREVLGGWTITVFAVNAEKLKKIKSFRIAVGATSSFMNGLRKSKRIC